MIFSLQNIHAGSITTDTFARQSAHIKKLSLVISKRRVPFSVGAAFAMRSRSCCHAVELSKTGEQARCPSSWDGLQRKSISPPRRVSGCFAAIAFGTLLPLMVWP